jgi:hypothetical protein
LAEPLISGAPCLAVFVRAVPADLEPYRLTKLVSYFAVKFARLFAASLTWA